MIRRNLTQAQFNTFVVNSQEALTYGSAKAIADQHGLSLEDALFEAENATDSEV